MSDLLLRRVRVPGQDELVDVLCRDGRFVLGESAIAVADLGDAKVIDGGGLWLLPGLIDVQVNDIEWLAKGFQSPESHVDRILEVAEYQLSRGVTGFVLATLAAPIEEILTYLVGMAHVLDRASSPRDGRAGHPSEAFLGGLVEGTFMNPEYHGAHNPDWVLQPDPALIDRLILTRGMRMLNIAPESCPAAIDCIAHATKHGVIVGCGHAKPNAKCVRRAIEAGLRYVIHLGNGPTGSSLKSFDDGGLLEESLRNDDLIATMIIDGYHVHPELIRDWIERKEVCRVVGVSDSGFALGPPESSFEVFGICGGIERESSGEGRSGQNAYLFVEPGPDQSFRNPLSSDPRPLFGSAIDQLQVFENVLNLLSEDVTGVFHRLHRGRPLADAVRDASAICSSNPAELAGLVNRGALVDGARADAILVDICRQGGRSMVGLQRTILAGEVG